MIKAVIFDWGGVLIKHPKARLIAYFSNALGAAEEAYNPIYEKFLPEFEKGMISEDTWWKNVCSELGVKKPDNQSLWGEAFRHSYNPIKEMFSLASLLKEKGYKVALLSNAELPSMHYFYEQQYDMFDVTVFSCAEGMRKPEKRIYEIALERLGVKPNEAIFIDDKQENIDAAKELGIYGILFVNPDQVKKELSSIVTDVLE
jgi:epoxide hydrolase-like predicted phosphatase